MRHAVQCIRMWAIGVALAALALGLWARAAPAAAIVYLYDSKSQVISMVAPDGSAVQWEWDSNGNLLSVARRDASSIPGDVGITLVSPPAGKVNDPVQIFGKGFSATPDQNTVTLNGVGATVSSATPTSLAVTVPATTTGLIHVVTPLGEANSPSNFTVLGSMTITPTTAQLPTGGTQAFTASEQAVWTVNGLRGGASELGTITSSISTTATYTAPTIGLPPREVTVVAQSPDTPTNRAEALVTIIPSSLDPVPVVRAPRLSLMVLQGPPTQATPWVAPRLSLVAQGGPTQASPLAAARLALQLRPAITGVTPAQIGQGPATLTLTGQGLAGSPTATLQFLRNGAPDGTITVTSLTAAGDTQATATVTVTAAPPGGRVVQITVSGVASTPVGTGSNVLTIQ